MSNSVLEQMISSYMATDQPQYAFGWQGGEPTLMGLDFFKHVTDLQKKYGHPRAQVANGLQTNCILITDDFAKHLAEYNFLVGVSLDGPAGIHNHYRKYAHGRGSHSDVIKGIKVLKRHNVEFNILTLVNHQNVRKPKEIYHYLCDNGFFYHQYIECVEFDKKGRLMPYAVSGREWGDFLCEIYDEWIKSDTRKVSIRLFDSILAMMVDGIANVCQMGCDCRQYFVVEHNGDIYPCDFFVKPELKLGNITEDSWEQLMASPVYAGFGNCKAQWNSRCDECEYLKFCGGDCQKNRFYGRDDPRQLSVLCRGWKQFYEHTLDGFERLADEIRAERAKFLLPVDQDARLY